MYRLDVFHPGSSEPTQATPFERAADALSAIADLLKQHADCERIVVLHDGRVLFAVDCKGATIS
jgi:hypothetical protein